MLVVMVETEEAIANIDSIVRVSGIHVVLVGPGDLMIDVKARDRAEAHHETLVQRVLDACRTARVAAGTYARRMRWR